MKRAILANDNVSGGDSAAIKAAINIVPPLNTPPAHKAALVAEPVRLVLNGWNH